MSKYVETLSASHGWNTIEHNLGITEVIVAIYRIDNNILVDSRAYQLTIKNSNSIVIAFGSPIKENTYWIVIIG